MSDGPSWKFSTLTYEQRSPSVFVVSGVQDTLKARATAETKESKDAKDAEDPLDPAQGFDFDMFDSPLLCPGKLTADKVREFLEPEGFQEDDFMQEEPSIPRELRSSPEPSDDEGGSDRLQPRREHAAAEHAGGVGGIHKPHEPATDFDLLRTVLGPKPLDSAKFWVMGAKFEAPSMEITMHMYPVVYGPWSMIL